MSEENYTLEIIEVERKKSSAIDGPDHVLTCANCNTKLVHIKVIHPDAPVTWRVCADCDCEIGEGSPYLEVKGEFRHSACDGCTIDDIHIADDSIVYNVRRLS